MSSECYIKTVKSFAFCLNKFLRLNFERYNEIKIYIIGTILWKIPDDVRD